MEIIGDKKIDEYDFICGICREILYKPISTLCGHNFCMQCLNNIKICPLCKSQNIGEHRDYNRLLDNIISERYPEKYKEQQNYWNEVNEIRRLSSVYLKSRRHQYVINTLVGFIRGKFYIKFMDLYEDTKDILYNECFNNLKFELYYTWRKISICTLGPYSKSRMDSPSLIYGNTWTPEIRQICELIGLLGSHMPFLYYNGDMIKNILIDYEKQHNIDNTDLWTLGPDNTTTLHTFVKSNKDVLQKLELMQNVTETKNNKRRRPEYDYYFDDDDDDDEDDEDDEDDDDEDDEGDEDDEDE
jgi:hypothetical protein